MNHDVIADRYARLFELPHLLGKSGEFAVNAICLDYHWQKQAQPDSDLRDTWRRISLPRSLFIGWIFSLIAAVKKLRPQCVVASSDCVHVILGWIISRCFKVSLFVDLYDDYSSFGLARVPGMKRLYSRALQEANGISVVSQTLGRFVEEQYPGKPVLILESTINAELFYPRDKVRSREIFKLNHLGNKKLVGVCGGLNAYHGVDIVFRSFPTITEQAPEVGFVVAGRLNEDCPLPDLPNVAYLGALPHHLMPNFFSAMDVVVVSLSNTRFGYFAFPQKAYEVLACNVPVAAADVGALSLMFTELKEVLYAPESPGSLAATVVHQLQAQRTSQVNIPTWEDQAQALGKFIRGRKE